MDFAFTVDPRRCPCSRFFRQHSINTRRQCTTRNALYPPAPAKRRINSDLVVPVEPSVFPSGTVKI